MTVYVEHVAPVSKARASGRKLTLVLDDHSEISVVCDTEHEARLIEAVFKRNRQWTLTDATLMDAAE